MGFFRKRVKRKGASSKTTTISVAKDDRSGQRSSPYCQRQNDNRKAVNVLRFPSFPPERKIIEQQNHQQRLWALSTQHIHRQYNPCEASLTSIHSGSLQIASPRQHPHINSESGRAQESLNHSSLKEFKFRIETSPSQLDLQMQKDNRTEPTSLCSAFEMLSFDTLCGTDDEKEMWRDSDAFPPLINEEGNSAGRIGVPHEISFIRQEVLNSHLDNLPEELADLALPDKRTSFLHKLLLKPAFLGRNSQPCNTVAKLNLYVEQPKPLEHTTSLENSTITWPNEYRGNVP
ncbi:hypothetical protein IV203_010004 [Nitzschia inconspicua]|uniref:Uncharacterized protein n=1 Tax=Nitzschia inconspicua TaxID=303405 RepID=A0A9K3KVA3_9STRA|nr:hypothetical protein IV203_010004 [Nitzschia inconspicua]